MGKAARTVSGWLGQIRKHLTSRSGSPAGEQPPRASNIILGMTLAMLAIVLAAWLLAHLFGLG